MCYIDIVVTYGITFFKWSSMKQNKNRDLNLHKTWLRFQFCKNIRMHLKQQNTTACKIP